jgi:hypothetical protein
MHCDPWGAHWIRNINEPDPDKSRRLLHIPRLLGFAESIIALGVEKFE